MSKEPQTSVSDQVGERTVGLGTIYYTVSLSNDNQGVFLCVSDCSNYEELENHNK